MATFTLRVDIPKSETRRIEVHHVHRALQLAAHEIGPAMGHKISGEITVPPDMPGAERVKIAEWSYETDLDCDPSPDVIKAG